eukprot:612262_1
MSRQYREIESQPYSSTSHFMTFMSYVGPTFTGEPSNSTPQNGHPHHALLISPTQSEDSPYDKSMIRQDGHPHHALLPSKTVTFEAIEAIVPKHNYSYTPNENLGLMDITLNNIHSIHPLPFNPNNSSKSLTNRLSCATHTAHPSSNQIMDVSMIAHCPNMVNNKCRCAHILRQNIPAHKIWSAIPECYHMTIFNDFQYLDDRQIDMVFFDGLYIELCEYFKSEVGSSRTPSELELSEVIRNFGGVSTSANDLLIDRCNFLSFWKWFRGAVAIVKDLYTVWDTKFPFQMNLFMDRNTCDSLLEGTPQGTSILRASQSQPNGVVLSYSETTFNRATSIRHVLLIRKSEQQYVTKTNRNSNRSSSLNQLIRTFVKLKFVYTPTYIYKKNQVF